MTSAKVQKLDVKSDSKESDDIAQSTSTPLQQDWQLGKSLGPCLLTLFDQQLWTDVCFIFLKDGKSTEIKAHRSILASRSPVFEAMFYGSLADTSEKIEIKDISPEAFRDVMRFVYSDELNADVYRLLSALCAAHKYRIVTLMKYCGRCLITKITIENVLDILQYALFLEQWELVYECTNFIDKNAESISKLQRFCNISQQALKFILGGNTFHLPEKDILDKVTMWAENKCVSDGLVKSTTNMRKVLGKTLSLIRLLSFDVAAFDSVLFMNKLILDAEKDEISRFLKKGITSQKIQMLSNPRVPKYDTFDIEVLPTYTEYGLGLGLGSESKSESGLETFVIEPNHIIILDGINLHTKIRYVSNSNKLLQFRMSLSSKNVHVQKRLNYLNQDGIEIMLNDKLLLFSGHCYEFKLELSCLRKKSYVEKATINRSLHTYAFSLSTKGCQLLKSLKIQNLSGRHEVNDWELKGCVDIREGQKDDTLVAAINDS